MTTLSRIALCVATLVLASPAEAQIRDFNSAADIYGRGVHAYFAGRTAEAEELFSLALADNPNDPRILYFRAMARLRLGRTDEARGDMVAGAEIESRHPGRFAVGTALSRVQGSDRLLLERFRQQARAKAAASKPPELVLPADNAPGVLRSRVIIPLDDVLRAGGPRPLTADEIARRAAAIESSRAAAAGRAAAPVESATVAAEPFGTGSRAPGAATTEPAAPPQDRAASDVPRAETTFEESPASDTQPAEEAPTGSDEDPFGDLN